MPRRIDEDKRQEARRLRAEGNLTLKAIAERVGAGERTVRRWVHDISVPQQESAMPSVPTDRQWPKEWTIDSLLDLPGFNRERWQGNLGLIEMAQRHGNEYVPRYFRRLVETQRHYQSAPAGANPWLYAIAALPVLTDWLGVPECQGLASLIEHHEPWNGGLMHRSLLSAYRKEALPLARAIEDGIGRALLFPPQSADAMFPITEALRILAQWLPRFDKTPLLARIQRMEIGIMFLLIFRNPKPEYGGTK